jgi:hypothetical protein
LQSDPHGVFLELRQIARGFIEIRRHIVVVLIVLLEQFVRVEQGWDAFACADTVERF